MNILGVFLWWKIDIKKKEVVNKRIISLLHCFKSFLVVSNNKAYNFKNCKYKVN